MSTETDEKEKGHHKTKIKTVEAIERAKDQLGKLTKLGVNGVIAAKKEKDNWLITLELLEKKSIPDKMDILGIYDVVLDEDGTLENFERRSTRNRGDVG